jgi:quinol monooxygenase YgiN
VSGKVDTLFVYRIKPGMEERFQQYQDKVLPVTRAREPYVLEYEIFQGGNGTYFQHERYENEEALWKHMEVTAAGQEDFNASTELESLTILGEMSEKFWEVFGGPGSVRYQPFRQITR